MWEKLDGGVRVKWNERNFTLNPTVFKVENQNLIIESSPDDRATTEKVSGYLLKLETRNFDFKK